MRLCALDPARPVIAVLPVCIAITVSSTDGQSMTVATISTTENALLASS